MFFQFLVHYVHEQHQGVIPNIKMSHVHRSITQFHIFPFLDRNFPLPLFCYLLVFMFPNSFCNNAGGKVSTPDGNAPYNGVPYYITGGRVCTGPQQPSGDYGDDYGDTRRKSFKKICDVITSNCELNLKLSIILPLFLPSTSSKIQRVNM